MTVDSRPARGVLLVEDQTPIRTLLAEALERAGFEVTACATPKAPLAAFPNVDPDLLVADIDLGSRPNGVELATILRTKAPYLGLVSITSYPSIRASERTLTPPDRYAFLWKDMLDSTDRLIALTNPKVAREVALDQSIRTSPRECRPVEGRCAIVEIRVGDSRGRPTTTARESRASDQREITAAQADVASADALVVDGGVIGSGGVTPEPSPGASATA